MRLERLAEVATFIVLALALCGGWFGLILCLAAHGVVFPP